MEYEKLTTNLSTTDKADLLRVAVEESLSKVEYKTAIEFLLEDWRKRNGKDKLESTTRK